MDRLTRFAPDAGNSAGGSGAAGAVSGQGDPAQDKPKPQPPANFDEWYGAQDETVKGLVDGHVKTLKGALDSERAARSELAKQIKELLPKAEKGSEAERAMQDLAAKLEAANQRADFFREASAAEVGCTRPLPAFLLAREIQAIDNKGRIDWAELKKQAPELFGKPPTPEAHAGAGTQGAGHQKVDMNTVLRKAAGY